MLEQLELPVRPLAKHRRRERLHDLLDGDAGARQLILGAADEPECAHSDGLQVDIARCHFKDCAEDGEFHKVGHCWMSMSGWWVWRSRLNFKVVVGRVCMPTWICSECKKEVVGVGGSWR